VRNWSICIALLLISGCSTIDAARFHHQLEQARKDARARIDLAECSAKDGKVEGIGIFGIPSCVIYYPDGGKVCSKKSDCESACLNPNELPVGSPATGTCARSDHDFFGCVSHIDNGTVESYFCQD
jgi:hypothetical protein